LTSKEQLWYDTLIAKGHTPAMWDEDLDIFFYDSPFHNGPGCTKCSWSCCWHCDNIDVIPKCPGKDGQYI